MQSGCEMNESFLTVLNSGCSEIVIQKSRFIGCVCPCKTEEEAQSFIQKNRAQYPDAKHHCYAYIIGSNSGIMRYSDDGEPGGTAGMPMISVLKNEGLVNLCIIVVRYFGGILLGTGGLVRAYTQSCKAALETAGIVRMELSTLLSCRISYSCWNTLQYQLQKMPVRISDTAFSESIQFTLCMKTKDTASVSEKLISITEGKIDFLNTEEQYTPWPAETGI